jgi:hypothetical protein
MYGPLIDTALYISFKVGKSIAEMISDYEYRIWTKIFLLNFKLIPFSFHFSRILFYTVNYIDAYPLSSKKRLSKHGNGHKINNIGTNFSFSASSYLLCLFQVNFLCVISI